MSASRTRIATTHHHGLIELLVLDAGSVAIVVVVVLVDVVARAVVGVGGMTFDARVVVVTGRVVGGVVGGVVTVVVVGGSKVATVRPGVTGCSLVISGEGRVVAVAGAVGGSVTGAVVGALFVGRSGSETLGWLTVGRDALPLLFDDPHAAIATTPRSTQAARRRIPRG